jgi:hypothetical protein
MDQAAPQNQKVFWDFRELGQDANMDRGRNLRAYHNCQKKNGHTPKPLHYSTNIESYTFRKNADYEPVSAFAE